MNLICTRSIHTMDSVGVVARLQALAADECDDLVLPFARCLHLHDEAYHASIYIYVYKYIYIHVRAHTHIHMHTYTYIHIYTHTYIHLHAYI